MSNTATALRLRPPRVPFVRPIGLRLLDGSQEAQWLFAGNLSLGGCFVRTAKPLPVGTEVTLELEARGQPLPFATAEVVWNREATPAAGATALPGCGLRFRPLSAEARALIMHLVDLGGTGRGQSRTVPLGMTAAPKLPSREPLHAPVALIRDYLHAAPKPPAEVPLAVPAPSFGAEAVTDPHGLAILAAPRPCVPQPKIEIDLGALEPDGSVPLRLTPAPVKMLGVGPPPASREPWFDASELHADRPVEPIFERASIGPVPGSMLAPPRRGSSLVASLFAGMAVGGAILGALVMAEKGLRLAHSPASARVEAAKTPDDALAEADNPPASAPRHTETHVAPVAVAPVPTNPAPVAPVAPVAPAPRPTMVLASVTAAPTPAAVAAPLAPSASAPSEGEIALPSGAATGVKVGGSDDALEIEPTLAAGSSIDRVFTLASPPRLVIDLNGASPRGAPHVDGRAGVTSVRLGSRAGGTRLVLDLARPASHIRTQGNRITVEAK